MALSVRIAGAAIEVAAEIDTVLAVLLDDAAAVTIVAALTAVAGMTALV